MRTTTHLPDYRPVGGREPPARLVELLREIDPTAELIYAGGGLWSLGTVRPNRITTQKGVKMIATLEKLSEVAGQGAVRVPRSVSKVIRYRLWRYELYRQGFRPISGFKVQGEPTSHIAEDFRARDWRYRSNLTAELARLEQEAEHDHEGMRQVDRLREYLELQGRDVHRHAFRRPVISIPRKERIQLAR